MILFRTPLLTEEGHTLTAPLFSSIFDKKLRKTGLLFDCGGFTYRKLADISAEFDVESVAQITGLLNIADVLTVMIPGPINGSMFEMNSGTELANIMFDLKIIDGWLCLGCSDVKEFSKQLGLVSVEITATMLSKEELYELYK
jgi:hypothetical protein